MSRSKSSPAISLFAFQDAITSVCGVVVLVTLMLALELTKRVELEATPYQESQEYAEKLQGEVDELNARLSQARETLQETARFDQETIGMTLEEVQRQYEQTEADLERAKLAREQTGERLQERSGLAEDFAARQKEIDKLQTELDALNAKTEKANQTASELRAKEGREVVFEYEGSAREKPWFVELAEKKIVVHSASGSPAPVSYDGKSGFMKWARTRPKRGEFFVLLVRPSGAKAYDAIEAELIASDYRYGVDLISETAQISFAQPEE